MGKTCIQFNALNFRVYIRFVHHKDLVFSEFRSPLGTRLTAPHNPHAISSAMRISLSLASGVRNALCADNVTFGSVVSL